MDIHCSLLNRCPPQTWLEADKHETSFCTLSGVFEYDDRMAFDIWNAPSMIRMLVEKMSGGSKFLDAAVMFRLS